MAHHPATYKKDRRGSVEELELFRFWDCGAQVGHRWQIGSPHLVGDRGQPWGSGPHLAHHHLLALKIRGVNHFEVVFLYLVMMWDPLDGLIVDLFHFTGRTRLGDLDLEVWSVGPTIQLTLHHRFLVGAYPC